MNKMVLSLGLLLLVSSFYVWGVGNMLMITYAVLTNTLPNLATAVIVLMMNIYGYREWSNND